MRSIGVGCWGEDSDLIALNRLRHRTNKARFPKSGAFGLGESKLLIDAERLISGRANSVCTDTYRPSFRSGIYLKNQPIAGKASSRRIGRQFRDSPFGSFSMDSRVAG